MIGKFLTALALLCALAVSPDAGAVNAHASSRAIHRTTGSGSSTSIATAINGSAPSTYGTFAWRCAKSGVLICQGFDDTSAFTPASGGGGYASGLYPTGADGTIQGYRDTSTKYEGNGALRFDIRAGNQIPFSTDPAGHWLQQFGPDGSGTKFGNGQTLYIQFSTMVDSNLTDYSWNSISSNGWKSFIVFGPIPGPSCTGKQFVQENSNQKNILSGYTSCSAPALVTHGGVTPYDFQQGYYQCSYGTNYATDPTCLRWQAGHWLTEYWVVHIGTFGGANTTFEAYAAYDGAPLRKFIDLPNFTLGTTANNTIEGLQEILLDPYFSGATASTANPAASMWFDSLIVSTKPIMQPGGFRLPTGAGWYEIPDTWIAPCLLTSFSAPTAPSTCSGMVGAWSGGAYDTARDRLIVMGGGHSDYRGNDLWMFDASNGGAQRATTPSDPICSVNDGYEWIYGSNGVITTAHVASRSHSGIKATITFSDWPTVAFGYTGEITLRGMGDSRYNKLMYVATGDLIDPGTKTVVFTPKALADQVSFTETTTTDVGGYTTQTSCEYEADGQPATRHNYGGLVYAPNVDKFIMIGGSLAGDAGNGGTRTSRAIWAFDLKSNTWQSKYPMSGVSLYSNSGIYQCSYSTSQGAIYCGALDGYVYRYDPTTNTVAKSSGHISGLGNHYGAAIDQAGNYIYFFGGGKIYSAPTTSTPTGATDITASTTGCSTITPTITGGSGYPGEAYDPVTGNIVAWDGGDTVTIFNPSTKVCTTQTYAHGPGAAAVNGTYGRFQYSPILDAFVVLNDIQRNMFALKLR